MEVTVFVVNHPARKSPFKEDIMKKPQKKSAADPKPTPGEVTLAQKAHALNLQLKAINKIA